MAPATAPDDPLLGQLIQNYCIRRLIDRGGMGMIYEAVHVQLPQRAAVKVLAPEHLAEPRDRERFIREAVACSRISHAGLVRVFDCGELPNGQLYILMEFLEGHTLRQRLDASADRRLELRRALVLTHQIAGAMAAVHAQGVVHRDLKPANLMLVADSAVSIQERAKVLDFGIAKLMTASSVQLTRTREWIGTALYMAPESADPDRKVDGQCDVYALGCVLYEMLCGRPPFFPRSEVDSSVVLFMHIKNTPVPPHRVAAGIPLPVSALVLKMLAKRPERRPTMSEVASEASRLADDPHGRRLAAWMFVLLGSGTRIALSASMILLLLLLLLFRSVLMPKPEPPPPAMVRIEAGSFWMGSPDEAVQAAARWARSRGYAEVYKLGDGSSGLFSREQPVRHVHLSTFEIDRTEITNRDFATFLEELNQLRLLHVVAKEDVQHRKADWVYVQGKEYYNLHSDYEHNGIAWLDGHIAPRVQMEQRPVTTVTWDAAEHYCRTRGKRLPTEAEWEFVATNRGRTRFPWGDGEPVDCEQAVLERGSRFHVCSEPHRLALPDVGTTKKDRTLLGVSDLGGSVSEWIADPFRPSYLDCGACSDPVSAEGTDDGERGLRVIRGGSWDVDFVAARSKGRMKALHDDMQAGTGFRCVRSVR